MRKKKKKEQEEIMRKKGEKLIKNQPKIVEWLKKNDGGQRKTHTGGKKGVGQGSAEKNVRMGSKAEEGQHGQSQEEQD